MLAARKFIVYQPVSDSIGDVTAGGKNKRTVDSANQQFQPYYEQQ